MRTKRAAGTAAAACASGAASTDRLRSVGGDDAAAAVTVDDRTGSTTSSGGRGDGGTVAGTVAGSDHSVSKLRSILNGVVGNYLEDTRNELSIPMTLHRYDRATGRKVPVRFREERPPATVASSSSTSARPPRPPSLSSFRQSFDDDDDDHDDTYENRGGGGGILKKKKTNKDSQDDGGPLRICILVHGLTENENTAWPFPAEAQDQSNGVSDRKGSSKDDGGDEDDDNDVEGDDDEDDANLTLQKRSDESGDDNSKNNKNNINHGQGLLDYGVLLQRDLGYVPYYVRYNTGLHISRNGQALDALLRALVSDLEARSQTPRGISDVVFLCHSMGGLVVRSALHYASVEQQQQCKDVNEETTANNNSHHRTPPSMHSEVSWSPSTSSSSSSLGRDAGGRDDASTPPPSSGGGWTRYVTNVIFLGTPHYGSFWEKLGNGLSRTMERIPRPYMKLASKIADLRSDGIQDLRYGYILDEDWNRNDPEGEEEEEEEEDRAAMGQVDTTAVQEEEDYGWYSNEQDRNTRPKKKLSTAKSKGTKTTTKAILPDWISYRVVTGTVTKDPDHIVSKCIGDALVRKDSSQGRFVRRSDTNTASASFASLSSSSFLRSGSSFLYGQEDDHEPHELNFSSDSIVVFPGIGHCGLAKSMIVYEQIKSWIGERYGNDKPESTVPDEIPSGYGNSDIPPSPRTEEEGQEPVNDDDAREEVRDEKVRSDSFEKWSSAKGVASLVQAGVGNGVQAVHGVHMELTDEIFGIVSRVAEFASKPVPASVVVPVTPASIVQTAKTVHDFSVNSIYGMIWAVSYGVTEVAKIACETMAKQSPQEEENQSE